MHHIFTSPPVSELSFFLSFAQRMDPGEVKNMVPGLSPMEIEKIMKLVSN